MRRKLHLSNAEGRDATVLFASIGAEVGPALGLPGEEVGFRRWLAATDTGLLPALEARYGDALAQALVEADPEVDIENVGRTLGATDNVFLSSVGEVLFASPNVTELVLGPDGSEKERRSPVDSEANVNESTPLRWSKMRLKRGVAARRFVFARSLQIHHVDGLSYDFLHAMAKELDEADEVVLVGGGPAGRDPLVFQTNGSPYRGFLEGLVDGARYQLLLHLSNLELKVPASAEGGS